MGSAAYMPSPELPTRVLLRPVGSALPLGLAGLAIASLLVSGLELSWVSIVDGHQVGMLVLVTAVPLQLVACVFALLARDGAAGSTMAILSATWAAIGLTRLTAMPGAVSTSLGLVLLVAAGVLAGGATGQAMGKLLPGLVVLLAAARFALTGIYELTANGGWQDVSGIVGLVVSGLAGYVVWALEFEAAADRTVLPLMRHGRGAEAMNGNGATPLGDVAHEPGVREQL